MVIQKYIIDLNGSKVDVTNRGCILWGCGEFAADIVKNYELENISFVVDGNSAKVGEIVCF